MRRDQASTPPKPESEIVAKAINNSPKPGRAGCDGGAGEGWGFAEDGSAARAAGEGGEVINFVYRKFMYHSWAIAARPQTGGRLAALFPATFWAYILSAGASRLWR